MKMRTLLFTGAAMSVPLFTNAAAAESVVSETGLDTVATSLAALESASHTAVKPNDALADPAGLSADVDPAQPAEEAELNVQPAAKTIPLTGVTQLAGNEQIPGTMFDDAVDHSAAPGSPAASTPVGAVAGLAMGGLQGSGESGRSDSYTVLLSQDSFFGFYPSFNGLIPISENMDFSFYGILWTTDAFGTALGSDLWTEFGVGLNFLAADGNLSIKPQIGLTNGALLSGGVRDEVTDLPTGTGGNFADGIVPSLTIVYSDDSFEAEFYGGYYAALRNRNDPGAADFLHTWINGGAKITENFSAGAHYEWLELTRSAGGNSATVYQWLGPYVQFSTGNGFFARFSAGPDIESGNDGDFYKLTAGFSF